MMQKLKVLFLSLQRDTDDDFGIIQGEDISTTTRRQKYYLERGDGGDGPMPDGHEDGVPSHVTTEGIEEGKRTDRWFERIDQEVSENRKRSTENKRLLLRLDYRTVWIARILVGIFATVVSAVIIQSGLI